MYIASIERFGYNLVAIGRTKNEAEHTLIRGYVDAYMDINGTHPADDFLESYDDEPARSYLDIAREEVYVREIKKGEVLWE